MSITVNKINSLNINNNNNQKNKTRFSTKAAATAGSLIGLSAAAVCIGRARGLKVPSSFKTKEFVDIFKKMEFNEKDVIALASSSIAGGFAGGVLTDKKNTKAKAKEGIVQLVGNYIFPSLFVGLGMKLNKILFSKYKFPPVTKAIQFAFGTAGFISGVFVGNKASQVINKNIFKEDSYRKLNWKDWAVQADNVCLVTSMAAPGTNVAKAASKIIPFAHIIPGYCVGTKN
ncbi:MAG: hypothetical protein KHX03_02525 [Clostridium sp.]|nr:hypothetical protein [Clostridium sp.]